MARKVNLRIWRGDATDGGLKDVQVDVNDGEVVLDVIHRVQATQMGDLAVRWNCKAGKCGSCSMEINGKPRLACMTQVASFAEDETNASIGSSRLSMMRSKPGWIRAIRT